MTLEARRKNQGKQYTVVSPEDRVIRHWHRPGDHLPVMLTHAGKDYLLTKEVVAEARKNQRSKLITLEVTEDGLKAYPTSNPLKAACMVPVAYPQKAASGEYYEIKDEVNWDVVGIVVGALFIVGALATFLTLGA